MKYTLLMKDDTRTEEDVLAGYEVAKDYDPERDEACPICSQCVQVCRMAMEADAHEVAMQCGADYLDVLKWMDYRDLHSNVTGVDDIAAQYMAAALDLDEIEKRAEAARFLPRLRHSPDHEWVEALTPEDGDALPNFYFLAAARGDVLTLVKIIKTLREGSVSEY